MKPIHRVSTLAALPLNVATMAHAQPIEQIDYSIVWDKPVLMPGEVQTGHVWLKVTPDIGSTVQWNTKPGTGQAATLMAIAGSKFDLVNIQNGLTGKLVEWQLDSAWYLAGPGSPPDGKGGILNINPGQFGKPINPSPNTNQSVSPFFFVWDPLGNYSPREVTYGFNPKTAEVWLDVPGLPNWVGEDAAMIATQSSFQIVPAPSTLAILVIGATALRTRRKR